MALNPLQQMLSQVGAWAVPPTKPKPKPRNTVAQSLAELGAWAVPNQKPTTTPSPLPPPSSSTPPPADTSGAGPGAGPGTGPGSTGTPALSLEEQAALLAKGIIDPQEATIQRGIDAKIRLMQAQGMGGAQIIDALTRAGAGIPGAIQGAYSKAGADIAGYAGSLTGEVGSRAQSAAADAAARLATLGAPGTVTSQAGDAMSVSNYTGGFLPASDLAAEAASRLSEAEQVGYGSAVGLAQTTLQNMNATRGEISDLQAQGVDLERTRPAEIEKQLLILRDDKRQQDALDEQIRQAAWTRDQAKTAAEAAAAQSKFDNLLATKKYNLEVKAANITAKNLSLAQQRAQSADLFNYGKMTGTIWAVDKKGRYYDTKVPAPGSPSALAAAHEKAATRRANITAASKAAALVETSAHNKAMESIGQQNADAATKRANAYAAKQKQLGLKKKQLTPKQAVEVGQDAANYAASKFNGVLNKNYEPRYDKTSQKYDADFATAGLKNDPNFFARSKRYDKPPKSAGQTLNALMGTNTPYWLAIKPILRLAKDPNSWWHAEVFGGKSASGKTYKGWFPQDNPTSPGGPGK